ncbi:glycerophosphodiester phosphodiesterase family protein [Paenibacillus sp. P46E]|uniref:glycerophosphodiester phosphodiesterase family protein n=1 Tax=Paenibacillus sp. P46E TaxID=1349436 RepID=UPI0009595A3A|nr:glycerophosphodiester phosphodiesterase family protein [Paenibacillus sp. P46E]OKP95063.1 hypothetical protein A3849_27990 [Paenibacillus sp. P46E]
MKKTKGIAAAVMIFALISMIVITPGDLGKEPATGFASHRIVAHTMGGINGHTYTNTVEAFAANYEQGSRVFEADLLLTADDQLVARHEWTNNMSKLLASKRYCLLPNKASCWIMPSLWIVLF